MVQLADIFSEAAEERRARRNITSNML